MELKGEKWNNYSTPYIDKYCKGEMSIRYGLDKLQTLSLTELKRNIDYAIDNYKNNGVNPNNVPIFIKVDNKEFVISNSSYCIPPKFILETDKDSELIFTAPDKRPEVGEFWRSRGASDYDCSGFVVSKLAGERLLRLVKYVLETDNPKSWLDFREYEPNWIQFKFNHEEFYLEKLHLLSIENGGVVTEQILRECKK